VACITTTTATALPIDDESRNFSLWIDESDAQTIAISKAVVAPKPKSLPPERLAQWHAIQTLIGKIRNVDIGLPPWFDLLVEKILPYGDVRIRRYWPAFVEATKVICMVRGATMRRHEIDRRGGLIVSFEDFATATHIFDKIIGQSLTRSGRDEDLATADIVETLTNKSLSSGGVTAGDLVGQPGIRSLDRAYRVLNRAVQAGTIMRINPAEKNNEKRYIRAPEAVFLGNPVVIARKLGLKISGSYIHPLNGQSRSYGRE
jgi:hypothetical protein